MDKRFLPPSYKCKLYLRITSLNQENLKVEEYIWEFEQVQLRVGLDEEPELKIAGFIKGYLLVLLARCIYSLTYPMMMCAT